jgi:hypothetical protein
MMLLSILKLACVLLFLSMLGVVLLAWVNRWMFNLRWRVVAVICWATLSVLYTVRIGLGDDRLSTLAAAPLCALIAGMDLESILRPRPGRRR